MVHASGPCSRQLPSFPVLEAVISILRDNAHVARVRIEGHTDNTGNERRNLELSQRRGSSVRRWLIEHGVAQERLEAFGCGQNVALRMNNTEEGRQANRRVEFIIIDPPPPGRGHVVSDRCLPAD